MRLVCNTPPMFFATAALTNGSPTVTLSGTSYVPMVGQPVAGTGIPAGTTILSVSPAVTLSQAAGLSGNQLLTFGLEPVTLAEAKLHLRLEIDDDDALVTTLITAARRYCETAIRAALVSQSWTLMLDSFPSAGGYYNRAIREIWPSLGGLPSGLGFYPGLIPNSTGVIDIPLPPLVSVTSVNYWDFNGVFQTVNPSTYNISLGIPGRIQPQYSLVWPISRPTIDSVQVSFVCGQGSAELNVSPNVQAAIKMLLAHWYLNREAVAQGSYATVPMAVDALLTPDEPGIYA